MAYEEKTQSSPIESAATQLDERPVTMVARSLRPATDPVVASSDAREFLVRYAMGETLGEGGMGEVKLCKDERIGREVAMKVIRAEHGGRDDLRARFLREVQVQGQLEHPSIVPVYDLGIGANGATYFTMKRVRGFTLADILDMLRAGDTDALLNFSTRKLLAAFGSVCLAIEFAHARKVLHRDLKPGNVMLGDFGEVYVLDWGIAKITGEADEESPAAVDSSDNLSTAIGGFVGTLGYLSPEQLSGDELDARSDVYALGAILFELLTLLPLHSGGAIAVAASTMKEADARCSVRAPTRDVPPELEQACIKATMFEPKDRFASARQLNEAVQRYLDGDRDTEHRRTLAAKHIENGMTALQRTEGSSSVNKATALRELGRSLALDPSNDGALDTIVSLLVEPPTEVPQEVREEIDASHVLRMRATAEAGLVAFPAGTGVFLLLLFWMGITSWPTTALIVVLMMTATALCVVQVRHPTSAKSYVIMSSVAFAYVAISRLFGAFILVPSLTMSAAMVYAAHPRPRTQRVSLFIMSSATIAPLVLEGLGVLPRSYVFHDGVMTVVSQLSVLNETTTMTFLTLTSTALLYAAWWVIQQVVNALKEADERLCLQAWQLRQLVPEQARHRVNLRR